MGKRLVLLASFFIAAPVFLISLVYYQLFLFHQDSRNTSRVLSLGSQVTYAQVPDQVTETKIAITTNEARVDVLREFFARYSSPLEEYAEQIVEAADKYGLDYRLLPAIAMQESTLCLKAPKGLNNCWGFGIYGKKKTGFEDYAQAIETVSKTLSEKYHAQGLVEPHEIMTKYTPSNDGVWAENVSYVMDRIEASL